MLYLGLFCIFSIAKFDTNGIYMGSLVHPDLTGPQGIAFDDRGHLFSSSFYQNQIRPPVLGWNRCYHEKQQSSLHLQIYLLES